MTALATEYGSPAVADGMFSRAVLRLRHPHLFERAGSRGRVASVAIRAWTLGSHLFRSSRTTRNAVALPSRRAGLLARSHPVERHLAGRFVRPALFGVSE